MFFVISLSHRGNIQKQLLSRFLLSGRQKFSENDKRIPCRGATSRCFLKNVDMEIEGVAVHKRRVQRSPGGCYIPVNN